MPETLRSLVREIAGYELRRLLGRPARRPAAQPAPSAPPPAATPAPPAAGTASQGVVSERWVQLVADRAMTLAMADPAPALAPARGMGSGTSRFDLIDLGEVPARAAWLVRSRAWVSRAELTEMLLAELGLGTAQLTRAQERLLRRLVYSAKGRRMIVEVDDGWRPGPTPPSPIPELSGRTLDDLVAVAGGLGREHTAEEVFPALLAELADDRDRAPRIVAVVAGTAIALARRRGDLDNPRRGHQAVVGSEEAA